MVFSSNRKTRIQNLYRKSVTNGDEELILETAQPKFATDWSPDGPFLLYFSVESKTGFDVWTLPLEGDRKPFPIVQTNFDERLAQFSYDGNWIAYRRLNGANWELVKRPLGGGEPVRLRSG